MMVDRMSVRLSNLLPEDPHHRLTSLGLDTVPSREQVYREIEDRLLLPQERLPEEWLSRYQVWVHCAALVSY
jgi:antiviral helicase SKI2